MSTVNFVVPDGIDDPARPSGGNIIDRRISRGLEQIGWSVVERVVPGAWPFPDASASALLADVVAAIPDGAVVLLDGLIASAAAQVLLPQSRRLRLVVLMHMPLGASGADGERADSEPGDREPGNRGRAGADGEGGEGGEGGKDEGGEGEGGEGEGAMLRAAAAVIATSTWTRIRLEELYALPPRAVHVAEPGVAGAAIAHGTAKGGELLCVAAVAPHKGHDLLVAALGSIADLDWRCTCVGATNRDPAFVDRLRRQGLATGLDNRIRFVGPLIGAALAAAYADADVLVLPSRAETYGMVVTEALARGIPVIATEVGGLPDALGYGSGGRRPGLLVSAGDADALAAALRNWLTDADLRQRLRRAAIQRRERLTGWSVTSDRIARVLAGVTA